MKQEKVKIADMKVLRDEGILITVGLGSCVGIVLYDKIKRVAGLAHILLSDSSMYKKNSNPAKFADTAIPLLIEKILRKGGQKRSIKAKIAGGSQLFNFKNNLVSVGEKNVEMVRNILKRESIPLVAEDVGGNYGRTMRVFAESGRVLISTVGKGEREL